MKYNNVRELVEEEFLKPFTKNLTTKENIFKLEEDDDNYYINAYFNNEKYHLVTLYKDAVNQLYKEYKEGNNV